ncbi:MAG: hypothetical protein JRE19_14995, partial [Deltaproteobacteria bacterium]|nr:hypothetical protein [Deltaproteobacteria bacterium]
MSLNSEPFCIRVQLTGYSHIDAKTATPKLSTPRGLIYVYQRDDEPVNGHHDWMLTAIDFRTGWRVFRIKGYFNKGEFDDNVTRIVQRAALGKGNYDRKVFNNIWGTFTFGPPQGLQQHLGHVHLRSRQHGLPRRLPRLSEVLVRHRNALGQTSSCDYYRSIMMRKSVLLVWTATVMVVCVSCHQVRATAPPRRPNVLLIVADDLGYSDIGP